jgi:hypothetical protein
VVVDVSLATGNTGQNHVVIFAVGTRQRGEKLCHQRLVGQCLGRGEHRA